MLETLLLSASSFGLGAVHALEPGHGKTVVGAYLIGSRGRARDAVFLGFVVTLSHTGVVILLGVLSTVAAAYFVPATVQNVLELVSGLLIVCVGGWMIGVRVRQARHGRAGGASRGHAHVHEDDHDHGHGHEDSRPAHGPGHQGHSHGHDPDSGHGHSHVPAVAPGQRVTLGQLVALGVSGGIVPCPAALAVLLLALQSGRLASGVLYVCVFSLGMAAALVAIGLLMLKAAGFASRYVSQSRWTRLAPVASAAIITAVGAGLTAKALVEMLR